MVGSGTGGSKNEVVPSEVWMLLATARGLITEGVFVSLNSIVNTSGSPAALVQLTVTVPFFQPVESGPVIVNAETAAAADRANVAV